MARIIRLQKNFADLELQRQGVDLEAELQTISDFLDQHEELSKMVEEDLLRGVRNPRRGRLGMNAEEVLRSLILQRIKNLSFRELRARIADSYTWRVFTRFFSDSVPKHVNFNRAFARLLPETVRGINETVIHAAVELGIENGRKLRVDTTVVETDIHYPTDASLLADSVRKLTRLVQYVGQIVPALLQGFVNHTRRAKRRMREIDRLASTSREKRLREKYRDLLSITQQVLEAAREVAAKSQQVSGLDVMDAAMLDDLRRAILEYAKRADQVIDQTRRRVFQGEKVPAREKLFSIFEPHTDLIMRGKHGKPLEFGHKVFLAETGKGLISDYRVLDGNPPDTDHVARSLEYHQELFGSPPYLYAGDRGFHSSDTVQTCQEATVEVECLPQRGGQRSVEREAYEKSRRFREGQRFRAGVEGRISVLFRGRGMYRCRCEGPERFEVFVGAAVLANNLLAVARHLNKKTARKAA
jgi:IS5 family transposase